MKKYYWQYQYNKYDTLNCDKTGKIESDQNLITQTKVNLIVWFYQLKTVLEENLLDKLILRSYKDTWKQNLMFLVNIVLVVAVEN